MNVFVSESLHFSSFSLYISFYHLLSITLSEIIISSSHVLFYLCLVSIILAFKKSSSTRFNLVRLFYIVVFCHQVFVY